MSKNNCVVCNPPTLEELHARVKQNDLKVVCPAHAIVQHATVFCLSCHSFHGCDHVHVAEILNNKTYLDNKEICNGLFIVVSDYCFECRNDKEFRPYTTFPFKIIGTPLSPVKGAKEKELVS